MVRRPLAGRQVIRSCALVQKMPLIALCSDKKIPEADCPCCYRSMIERQRMTSEYNQLYTMHKRLLSRRERKRVEHRCHVGGCGEIVRSEVPFCVGHWYAVDENLRNEIWRAYKAGDHDGWAELVGKAAGSIENSEVVNRST